MSSALHASQVPGATPDDFYIPVLAVAGVGLIGGSFCAALRKAQRVGRIIGVGRNAQTLRQAQAFGLIDTYMSAAEAAHEADFILLATPVGAMHTLMRQMQPHLKPNVIITDGGSSKSDVVAAARAQLDDRINCFVPGHPIAGSDQSGPEAASANLFTGRTVILTPLPENAFDDIARVQWAWQACGARVCQMPHDVHDKVLASVSHLPHLLAIAYMYQVAKADDAQLRLNNAGPGFRDFTRIAGSSPEMWRDILLSNREAVLDELNTYRGVLDELNTMLVRGDATGLEAMLQLASEARRGWTLP